MSVYLVRHPGSAPLKNERGIGTKGHRARGTKAWRESFLRCALASVRHAGLWQPLECDVWLIVEDRVVNGRRDAAASVAEVMDALECPKDSNAGVYRNDRQVREVSCRVNNRAERMETVVWVATTREEWLQVLGREEGE